MMRSLFSGISGLRNHQTRMDVIGNNIANVNTAGYKTARVIFQDIFSQNLSAGMANQGDMGGTNPMQVGLGIRLSTVDVIHTRAAFQRTDKETDMMINGDGFFIVSQINPDTNQFETFYTRAGNFDIDNEGFLVTSQGFFVMGRNNEMVMGIVDEGGPEVEAVHGRNARTFQIGQTIPLTMWRVDDVIPEGLFRQAQLERAAQTIPVPAVAGPLTADQIALLRAGDEIPAGTFVGQPPGRFTITQAHMANPTGVPAPSTLPRWLVENNIQEPLVLAQADAILASPAVTLTAANIDDLRNTHPTGFPITAVAGADGFTLDFIESVAFQPFRPPLIGLTPGGPMPGADANGLTRTRVTATALNVPVWDNLTAQQQADLLRARDSGVQADLDNFLAQFAGTEREVGLPGFAVADNGDMSVIVGNRKLVIGTLALAMFSNPAGLEAAGNSLFRQTDSSGNVVITEAFMDGAGRIEGGGLEMSNVDLANEFTDMIVTQRGFQANSRIVTVTDTMLEELVNLKR